MGFPLIAAGVGTVGATGGALAENALGNLMGGNGDNGQGIQDYTNNMIKQMNKMITSGQTNALSYSEKNTNQAINAQNQYMSGAIGSLQNYLGQANTAATGAVHTGLAQYQALQSPYAMSGYNAMDAYNDSLGLSRPQMGGAAIASALGGAQKAKDIAQGIFGSTSMPQSLPTAPTAPTPYQAPAFTGQAPTMAQAQAAVANPAVAEQLLRTNKYFQNNYLRPGETMSGLAAPYALADMQRQYNQSVQAYQQEVARQQQAYQGQLGQYNTQMGQYQNQLGNIGSYFGQLQSAGYTPQQAALAAAYNKGLFTK